MNASTRDFPATLNTAIVFVAVCAHLYDEMGYHDRMDIEQLNVSDDEDGRIEQQEDARAALDELVGTAASILNLPHDRPEDYGPLMDLFVESNLDAFDWFGHDDWPATYTA